MSATGFDCPMGSIDRSVRMSDETSVVERYGAWRLCVNMIGRSADDTSIRVVFCCRIRAWMSTLQSLTFGCLEEFSVWTKRLRFAL